MIEPPKGTGDAGLEEPDRMPPASVCLASHPLLEDVHCLRLRGHPGKHAAQVETASAEILVQWVASERRAG